VIALGDLAHHLALPPGRRVEKQRAAGFRAVLESLAGDGVAFPFVGFEKGKGGVDLVFSNTFMAKLPVSLICP